MENRKFSSALTHLDDAMDRNLDQDHGMHQVMLKIEAIHRRMREAFDAGDRDRLDVEITYLAAISDQAKALEQGDLLNHTTDRQLWWEIRPYIAFKSKNNAPA